MSENTDEMISVICHRAFSEGYQESVGYIKTEAKGFSPNTPVSEIMEWATGDQAGRDNPPIGENRRTALFRIELSVPNAPDPWEEMSKRISTQEKASHDPDEIPF